MQQQEFQRKLHTSCWQVGVRGQITLANLDGQNRVFDVVNGKCIPLHVESFPYRPLWMRLTSSGPQFP